MRQTELKKLVKKAYVKAADGFNKTKDSGNPGTENVHRLYEGKMRAFKAVHNALSNDPVSLNIYADPVG